MLEITETIDLQDINCQNSLDIKEIDRISNSTFTYNDFFVNYMVKNIPVIITGISKDWQCNKYWLILQDKNMESSSSSLESHKIDFENLRFLIPNMNVPISNCCRKYFNSHEKYEMKFYEFLTYWKNRQESLMQMSVDNSSGESYPSFKNEKDLLYLKDWHLKLLMPEYEFYQQPIYFGSDWLNEYLSDKQYCTVADNEAKSNDYRFVYMGPTKSWTPFHSDVFSSFSWSTNVIGRKKWLILQPNEERKLFDKFGNLPFSVDESVLDSSSIRYYNIIQNMGDTIFVPSNWYHQVENLCDTISINHNWFNGCNINGVWLSLRDHYQKVIQEISDCSDMENFLEHCQIMLQASYGMNYKFFIDLLEFISNARIMLLTTTNNNSLSNNFNNYLPNKMHCLFDLKSITNVLNVIINDESLLNYPILINKCLNIKKKIDNISVIKD